MNAFEIILSFPKISPDSQIGPTTSYFYFVPSKLLKLTILWKALYKVGLIKEFIPVDSPIKVFLPFFLIRFTFDTNTPASDTKNLPGSINI